MEGCSSSIVGGGVLICHNLSTYLWYQLLELFPLHYVISINWTVKISFERYGSSSIGDLHLIQTMFGRTHGKYLHLCR